MRHSCRRRIVQPGRVRRRGMASHATADVIFRTLFSMPIDDAWQPRLTVPSAPFSGATGRDGRGLDAVATGAPPRRARRAAEQLRALIAQLVADRQAEIAAGTAPDDLATKIMTTRDPETGRDFSVRPKWWIRSQSSFWPGTKPARRFWVGRSGVLAAAPEWGAQVAEEAARLSGSA